MASKSDLPVPIITTLPASGSSEPVASPDGDYFPALTPSSARTPARSASPATPANRPTTPIHLLRTPPLEPQSPSHSRARTPTPQNEFSARSPRSSTRITRTASPSDNRSNTLSPSISSGGGSFHSSDTGRSPCSASSSEYLTPPQFQEDCDKKPYRARRQSSNSLSMAKKPKKARTTPHKPLHRHNRHRRGHKCHRGNGIGHEQVNDPWRLPGCQIAPTAPRGMKEICQGHTGKYQPIMSTQGNSDIFGRSFPHLRSDPAPPIVSRRWSSIEVGSHQIHLASILPPRSAGTSPDKYLSNTGCIPREYHRPNRGSTLTLGAIDHDIVRTVRDRLTVREVPTTKVQAPASITLRRASGASTMGAGASGATTVIELLTPANGLETGGATPRQYPKSQGERHTNTAYLITRQEIDSITELIEANIRRQYRSHNRVSAHPPITPPSRTRSPINASLGSVLSPSSSFLIARQSETALSVAPRSSKNTRVTQPQNGKHEIIWEAGGSPSSQSSMERKASKDSSASSSPRSEREKSPVTPHQPVIKPLDEQPRLAESGAFDPKNARSSINEWSWRLPPAEIPPTVTSSESADRTPASEAPPAVKPKNPIRSVASAPDVPRSKAKSKARHVVRSEFSREVEDVISFPPLPARKATQDWYSPLPDIASPLQSPGARALYGEGLDATGVTSVFSQVANPPTTPFLPPAGFQPRLPRTSVEFDPDFGMRRKSIVKAHPHPPARTGAPSAMGSSIGASSGARRKSSVRPGLQRVSTIDNIHKGKRTGTWTRNRPPSVCPPPQTPSPAEFDDDSDGTMRARRSQKGSQPGERPGQMLEPEQGPPVPKADKVGIYEKITGSVKSVLGLNGEGCDDECPPRHDCDDCKRDPRSPSVDWIG